RFFTSNLRQLRDWTPNRRATQKRGNVDNIAARNLYAAVSDLYTSGGGRVVELGFITDNSSVKHQKVRTGGKCIRRDAYHKGGTVAVGNNITPFKIAVQWNVDDLPGVSSLIEVSLNGIARMTVEAMPQLVEAVVRNAFTTSHNDLIASKLESAA
ncbi:MAG: hypothetical protein ABJB01_02820, partial [Rudaea sp.]